MLIALLLLVGFIYDGTTTLTPADMKRFHWEYCVEIQKRDTHTCNQWIKSL